MAFTQRTSLHGRKFGMSSTGGLITPPEKDSTGSTLPHTMAAQMWGEGMHAVVTSTISSTLSNYGLTTLTSGTATAIVFEIGRPEVGVNKTIYFETTAEHFSLGGTSTEIIFRPASAGVGSTLFLSSTRTSIKQLSGEVLHLRGASTARWMVLSGPGSSAAFVLQTIG